MKGDGATEGGSAEGTQAGTMRLVVFGCGYSAGAFARALPPGAVRAVTVRTPEKAAALRAEGLPALVFDGERPGAGVAEALGEATHVLASAAPGERGDPVLAWHGADIREAAPRLRWIGYLSTVGVYGDHGGAWVDETTPPRPVSRRSRERVAAEGEWAELAAARGVKLAILRLSGIYGLGRSAFDALREGRARRLVKPGQVFNRIHVDDIAGALALLAARDEDGVFNVTDDEPAPPQDVVEYAARLGGYPVPPETDFATAELSPMARSFYGENKRVSNARIRALGYRFLHPTFREGLEALKPD